MVIMTMGRRLRKVRVRKVRIRKMRMRMTKLPLLLVIVFLCWVGRSAMRVKGVNMLLFLCFL